MIKNKKILFISYHMPPMAGPGIFRALKILKYLPVLGWKISVLTSEKGISEVNDYSLSKQIDDSVEIYKAKNYEPRSMGSVKKVINVRRKDEEVNNNKFIFRFLNFLRNNIFIPDEQIGWIIPAVIKGKKIIKEENIKIIMATAPPFSAHLIGLILARINKTKLVVDFRDLWTKNSLLENNTLRDMIFERMVIKKADKVILNTKGAYDIMINNYSDYKEKFTWISNGYDEDELILNDTNVENKKFVISYAGGFYNNIDIRGKYTRTPKYFFTALQNLLNKNKIDCSQVQINFIGNIDKKNREIVENSSLIDCVKLHGYLNHDETLKILVHSDILLLIEGDISASDAMISQKIYEYMGLKKFIFALVDSNNYNELLKKYKAFVQVHPTNISDIENKLLFLFDNKNALEKPDENYSSEFSWNKLAKRINKLLVVELEK